MPHPTRVFRRPPRPVTVTEADEEAIFITLTEILRERLETSITARAVLGGYVDLDEDNPSLFTLNVQTKGGLERYVGAKLVPPDATPSWQGAAPAMRSGTVSNDTPAPVTTADLWNKARNTKLEPTARLQALRDLALQSVDISAFVASELSNETISEEWRDLLVFLAEDVHFPEPSRAPVGERLLSIASSLRSSTKAGADKVVWSAMRRAASLTSGNPSRFLEYLDRQGVLDTRAVALLCIQRAFATAPPCAPEQHREVADRVASLATKFLDKDVFAAGENGLIAKNAICALAALGDQRLHAVIETAKALNRRWLKFQLRAELSAIQSAWRANTHYPADSTPAEVSLSQAIELLR